MYKWIGTALFIIGMIFYVRYAIRKANRDYEQMRESDRKHAQWMVEFGRDFPRRER